MYVTDVPVIDRLTDPEAEAQSKRAERAHQTNLEVHVWAASHTGRRY